MPIYKSLPKTKKKENPLPLQAPVDRLLHALWGARRILAPILGIFLALLAGIGIFRIYSSHYDDQATQLLSQKELAAVVRDYPRSPSAAIARVKMGEEALEKKNYDEAAKWFEPVANHLKGPPIVRIGALQTLAFIAMKKGDLNLAQEWMEKAVKDPGNVAPDYTKLLLAQILEQKNEPDKAHEIYQALSEGTPITSIQEEAKSRLAQMDKERK